MPITKGFRTLVDEAMAQVTTYSVQEVAARLSEPGVQIVDIRDVRELEREGTLPGALLAPRGMLGATRSVPTSSAASPKRFGSTKWRTASIRRPIWPTRMANRCTVGGS